MIMQNKWMIISGIDVISIITVIMIVEMEPLPQGNIRDWRYYVLQYK